MIAYYFPAWNRKKNTVTEDFRIEAATLEEARQEVCKKHAAEWIIGDCRHCHYI